MTRSRVLPFEVRSNFPNNGASNVPIDQTIEINLVTLNGADITVTPGPVETTIS